MYDSDKVLKNCWDILSTLVHQPRKFRGQRQSSPPCSWHGYRASAGAFQQAGRLSWTRAGEPCRCSRGFLIIVNADFRFQIKCVLKWRNTSATCYNDKQRLLKFCDISWNYVPKNQQKQHLKGSRLIGISNVCRYATKPQNPFPPE